MPFETVIELSMNFDQCVDLRIDRAETTIDKFYVN